MVDPILAINAQAVTLLHLGDYRSAAEYLRQGIAKLEKEADCDGTMDDQDYDLSVADQHVVFGPTAKSVGSYNSHSSFAVYGKPMALSHDQELNSSQLSDHDCNLLSSVFLYNYGFCLQLQAFSSGDEAYLEDALLAYEMALGLLGLISEQNQPWVCTLELAALNNCGQIHHHYLNTLQVHECMQRMHFVLYDASDAWTKPIPQE